jgi:peptidoglycan/xylan/chitin deacetylase (PgdA/CDA1 family)
MSACLMLHGLGDPPPHVGEEEKPYWITEAMFAGILDLAKKTPARLTIDDGNASDVAIALPALERAGLTATFFIPSDRIGTAHYVSEADVRALHEAGMEIGSHGCAHLHWTDASDAEIARDVTRSMERLSAIIGEPVRSVAIPFGHCDTRVLGILRRLGAGRVYSSFHGPESEDAWLVRRDCVMGDMTLPDVNALLTAEPTAIEAALTFLRIWRHAGRAAVLKV